MFVPDPQNILANYLIHSETRAVSQQVVQNNNKRVSRTSLTLRQFIFYSMTDKINLVVGKGEKRRQPQSSA